MASPGNAEASPSDKQQQQQQPNGEPSEQAQAPPQRGPVQQPKPREKKPFPVDVVFGLGFISFLLFALWWLYQDDPPEKRLFNTKQLELYNGNGAPMYLAILGEVYDVTPGKKHYGKGGGYAHFVGRDASRAFVTGNFHTDLTDNTKGLSPEQCASLVRWRSFYRNHTEYKLKGRVIGKFYNKKGEPLPALLRVEEQAAKAKSAEERQKEVEAKWPRCNVRWSEAAGGYVWCDDGQYPRKVFTQQPGGEPSARCACFKEIGWSDVRQVYPNCAPDAHECQTSPPGPAPRPSPARHGSRQSRQSSSDAGADSSSPNESANQKTEL